MTTYYVDPNGSDSANGTSTSTPWQTISHAISNTTNGDLVYCRYVSGTPFAISSVLTTANSTVTFIGVNNSWGEDGTQVSIVCTSNNLAWSLAAGTIIKNFAFTFNSSSVPSAFIGVPPAIISYIINCSFTATYSTYTVTYCFIQNGGVNGIQLVCNGCTFSGFSSGISGPSQPNRPNPSFYDCQILNCTNIWTGGGAPSGYTIYNTIIKSTAVMASKFGTISLEHCTLDASPVTLNAVGGGAVISQFRNTIFANTTTALTQYSGDTASIYNMDYNLFYNVTNPTANMLPPSTLGGHTLVNTNPLFVGTGTGQTYYSLQAGSPAINAGSNGTTIGACNGPAGGIQTYAFIG